MTGPVGLSNQMDGLGGWVHGPEGMSSQVDGLMDGWARGGIQSKWMGGWVGWMDPGRDMLLSLLYCAFSARASFAVR